MIQPLGERVLVEQEVPKEVSEGGIVIPETAQHQSGYGKVMEAGDGCIWLKKGDTIVFARYVGTKIRLEGDSARDFEFGKHVIIKEDDVLGVEKSGEVEVPV